ncbi:MAG: chain-length determining protein, partial [Muribaculaceae bacterium]|nr:chain-length determining protein [Muribaculaceae bacterium]
FVSRSRRHTTPCLVSWGRRWVSEPGTILSLFKSSDKSGDTVVGTDATGGPIKITEEQSGLIGYIGEAVSASVDQKTSIIYISVTTQDPVVAATLADTVANRLQEYIISYRTQKARQDLEFTEKLNEEAKEKYYSAQQKFANYLDSNQGLVLFSAQTMRDRLENEATLAFNVYNQTSQKLELAKAKVQEQTPVFATIEPAVVPIRAAKPRKPLILIAFVFLGFAAAVSWILFAEPLIDTFRQKLKQ